MHPTLTMASFMGSHVAVNKCLPILDTLENRAGTFTEQKAIPLQKQLELTVYFS